MQVGPSGEEATQAVRSVRGGSDGRVIWVSTIAVGLALVSLPFAVWLNVLAGVPLLSHASGLQPDAVFVVSYAAVGLFITHRVPGNRLGPLLCLIATLQAAAGLATAYAAFGIGVHVGGLPYDDVLFKLSGPLFVASFISFTVWLPLWFPTGKGAARAFALIGWLGVGAIVAISAGMVRLHGWTAMAFFTGEPLPAFASTMFRISDDLQQILPWFALATLGYRYRISHRVERRQLRWFIVAAASIAITVADAIGSVPSWLDGPRQVPWIPLAIGVAIWHDGLYDLNLLIRRSVVYGALLATILAVYVTVVEVAAVAFNSRGVVPSLLATALVALVVQPARVRLERYAERIVYGGRRDPRRALVDMGERLRSSKSDEMLTVLCGAVVEGARVPGAAIVLPSGAQAHVGAVNDVVEEFPLVNAGESVGRLCVSAHTGERSLDRPARTVVTTILPVVTAAVHAWSLADDVRQSRQRLVSAREEERRRLRRDLHDGLGPALAGITLEIQAAQSLMDVDRVAAAQMLQAAEGWARDAISEIRRVVYGLRPPALDQLGLVRAIEEHAAALDAPPLSISIDAVGLHRSLPAATEVAAYLITLEALTNVVHHANATTCRIALRVTPYEIELEVVDNGQGIGEGAHHGVGLSSMRERAEELGGTVVVGPAVPGTRVEAHIPLGIR